MLYKTATITVFPGLCNYMCVPSSFLAAKAETAHCSSNRKNSQSFVPFQGMPYLATDFCFLAAIDNGYARL